ncbi:MAG: GNAT family N-acetyltransferase, partial [Anaerolineae bacterium]|nr:GNAT family N-acetyltransferase [Anaerolineae bacterium]
LEAILSPLYPDESRHGYSIQKLIDQKVKFFVIRHQGEAAGCAGVQIYENNGDVAYGEAKRMYVRPRFRSLGLAKLLLQQLEETVAARGITLLRLETGIHQTEAIQLYEQNGFRRIDPFGEYFYDPLSICYEKQVSLAAHSQNGS